MRSFPIKHTYNKNNKKETLVRQLRFICPLWSMEVNKAPNPDPWYLYKKNAVH